MTHDYGQYGTEDATDGGTIARPQRRSRRDMGEDRRRPKNRHVVRTIVLTVLLLLIALAAVGGFCGLKLYKEALQVRDHETKAVQSLTAIAAQDILGSGSLDQPIAQAQSETKAARDITDGTLWKVAAHVPMVGDDITTVRGMTEVLDDVTRQALPPLSDTITTLKNAKLSNGASQLNLQPIEQARTSFGKANTVIQAQRNKLDALPSPRISMVGDAYDQSVKQFDAIADQTDQLSGSLNLLPNFLGGNGQRTYLLMAQTPSEARSSGGLVGSLGSMTMNNGTITVNDFHPNKEFNVHSVLNDDERAAFQSLQLTVDARNAAALPDFSHVADILNKTWQDSAYASNIDGVIAVDPVFIQQMVAINGNITLPDGRVLTGENTAEFMLNGIYKELPVEQQDAYFEYAVGTAMNTMFSNMTTEKIVKIATSMTSLAQQRHLYMTSFHKDENADFVKAGLVKSTPNSRQHPELGIYVNEMRSSKMDWYLHRKTTITRRSCNADGSQTYHVRFQITNTIPASDLRSDYSYIIGIDNSYGSPGTTGTALLFYPPAGGSIGTITASGVGAAAKAETFDGNKIFASKTNIAPGQTATYDFDVTTSTDSTTDLELDQTPMGWLDPGVTYDTAACAIKR